MRESLLLYLTEMEMAFVIGMCLMMMVKYNSEVDIIWVGMMAEKFGCDAV